MDREKDIVYSEAVKAGKRIYYLDVKRNRKGELFLAITESKKIATGEGPDTPYTFEKHKIFLKANWQNLRGINNRRYPVWKKRNIVHL